MSRGAGKMNTHMNRCLLMLVLILTVACAGTAALAATVTVDMTDEKYREFGDASAMIELYKIASYAGDGWQVVQGFRTHAIQGLIDKLGRATITAAEGDAAIASAREVLQAHPGMYAALETGRVRYGSTFCSTELDTGLYLGQMSDTETDTHRLFIRPFLIYLTESVTIEPKADRLTSVCVEKNWIDGSDGAGERPSVEAYRSWLRLYADDADVTEKYESLLTCNVKPDMPDCYMAEWSGLPMHQDGHSICYTVGEATEGRYVCSSTECVEQGEYRTLYSLTNHLQTGELRLMKTVMLHDAGTVPDHLSCSFLICRKESGRTVYYRADGSATEDRNAARIALPAGSRNLLTVSLPVGRYLVEEMTDVIPQIPGYTFGYLEYGRGTGNTSNPVMVDLSQPGSAVRLEAVNHYFRQGVPATEPAVNAPAATVAPTTARGTGSAGRRGRSSSVPMTELRGEKIWVDEDNQYGLRPGSIDIHVFADGEPVDAQVDLTGAGATWQYRITGLPLYAPDGHTIRYSVMESAVAGYETSMQGNVLVNTLIARQPSRTGQLTIRKQWQGNADEQRPVSVVVDILRNGIRTDTVTLKASDGWAIQMDDMPMDDGYGHAYTYTFQEHPVAGYYMRMADGVILNARIPDHLTETQDAYPFDSFTAEELEELIHVFDYSTPLYNILGTGNEIPLYIYLAGAAGLTALVLLIFLTIRQKRKKADA